MIAECVDEEVELLEFLYACPVGLVELSADGTIKLINPHAMQLLSPLVPRGTVDNLYAVLCDYLPELRHIVASFREDFRCGVRWTADLHPTAPRVSAAWPTRSCCRAHWSRSTTTA